MYTVWVYKIRISEKRYAFLLNYSEDLTKGDLFFWIMEFFVQSLGFICIFHPNISKFEL